MKVQRVIVFTLTSSSVWALASHFKVLLPISFFYVMNKVLSVYMMKFYVMNKALSGKLSCTWIDLVWFSSV